LLNAGDIDGAISQFRSAIESVPGYAPAHYQLGLALQRKGDKQGAAREFKMAVELDPKLRAPSP
jgi:Flp pilus assembly protein TadD